MLRTKSFLASTLIAMTFAFVSNAMADDFDDLPNVQQYVVDDATSMSALARTEQKLGYMGDIDDVRWTLYKCISLDVGAGVIRAGLGCETTTSTGGSTQVSDEYKKLQEEFSDTVCKQNANWETFTSQMGNKQKAGTVSCSSLANAYCSASNAEKASANLTTYYECTKNGKPISCVDLAETYCTITNIHPGGSSEEDSGSDGTDTGSGSTSGTSDADKAAIQQKEKEDQAKEAVTKSNKRKCIVDGEEVDCDDLAEANEIRKKTNKESTFDDDSTECYADITCKDSDGLTVDCKKARDVIQCGQSSSEGLSIEYSCFVGGETVDCGFLGEGECTESVCNEMCPEYGGAVLNNTCTCYNVPAVCAGMCEYGAQVSENSRSIATVEVTNSGSGYSDRGVLSKENLGLTYTLTAQSSTPKVKVTIYDEEGSGSGATGEAVYTVDNTNISTTINITGITINTTGSGYTSPKATVNVSVGNNSKAWGVALDTITYPTVTVSDSTGSGAVLKAILNNGKITAIQVLNGGTYYVDPVITITSNAGSGAEAKVSKITDCVCNEMPDCSVECEFSGVPFGNGTNKCDCYTEPDCNDASHCKYGGYPEVKSDDSAYVCTEATCPYGYLTDDNPDKCDASICPYGTSSGGDDCSDSSICPYGGTKNADGSCVCNDAPLCTGVLPKIATLENSLMYDYYCEDDCPEMSIDLFNLTEVSIVDNGGSGSGAEGKIVYNFTTGTAHDSKFIRLNVTGFEFSNFGTGYVNPKLVVTARHYYNPNSWGEGPASSYFKFSSNGECAYGGTPKADGTNGCICNDAPNCNLSSVCAYGGTAKSNGTNVCECNEAPKCIGSPPGTIPEDLNQTGTNFCEHGGSPKADGSQACACYDAPVCSGPQSSQTGDYYFNSYEFEFCVYGGKPSPSPGSHDCYCNEEPDCSKQCAYGGTAKADGTSACSCDPAPDCTALCAYGGTPKANGTQACACIGDCSSLCDYGGTLNADWSCTCDSAPVCSGPQSSQTGDYYVNSFGQTFEFCAYGGSPSGDGTQACDCNSAPDCYTQCPQYGGTPTGDGTQSCACNDAPVCSGPQSSQTGDYYISSEFEFCAYGGSALGSGTQMCLCESAPNCNVASVCTYGGTAKGNGTQDCSCNSAPNCNSICTNGGTAKADGTQGCTCNSGPTLTVKTGQYTYIDIYLADGTTVNVPFNSSYTVLISKLTSNNIVMEGTVLDTDTCFMYQECGTNVRLNSRDLSMLSSLSIIDRSKNAYFKAEGGY